MKKILIIFSVLIVMALSAFTIVQTLTEPVQSTIDYSGSYVWYNGAASDTIGRNDSIWTYSVQKKSLSKQMPYVYIAIDSTGGTNNQVVITLESKVFEQENYIVRETKTWKLGRDTTLSFASDSFHISEFWRVKLKGANDNLKAKVTKLNLKFVQ